MFETKWDLGIGLEIYCNHSFYVSLYAAALVCEARAPTVQVGGNPKHDDGWLLLRREMETTSHTHTHTRQTYLKTKKVWFPC